jgi:hypothetical protein
VLEPASSPPSCLHKNSQVASLLPLTQVATAKRFSSLASNVESKGISAFSSVHPRPVSIFSSSHGSRLRNELRETPGCAGVRLAGKTPAVTGLDVIVSKAGQINPHFSRLLSERASDAVVARALLPAVSALMPTLVFYDENKRRNESRRGRHECPRHVISGSRLLRWLIFARRHLSVFLRRRRLWLSSLPYLRALPRYCRRVLK